MVIFKKKEIRLLPLMLVWMVYYILAKYDMIIGNWFEEDHSAVTILRDYIYIPKLGIFSALVFDCIQCLLLYWILKYNTKFLYIVFCINYYKCIYTFKV